MTPTSVLLVASNPDHLRLLLSQFPRQLWKPMAARAAEQVHKVLPARPPEVALIMERLDDATGAQLCAWIRQQAPQTALVLLTEAIPAAPRPGEPWDAAVRYPAPEGVLLDAVRSAWQRRHSEDPHLMAFLAEIEARVHAMDQQTYQQLLGLPQDPDTDLVRQAYDAFSLRFHPDRYLGLRQSHPQGFVALNNLYKRIGEAYRVLGHPQRLARYHKMVAAGELRYNEAERQSGPARLQDLSDNPRVKRFLKLAQDAVEAANPRGALQNLRFALSMEADNQALKDAIVRLETEVGKP